MLTVGDNNLNVIIFERFEKGEKRIARLERLMESHLNVAKVKDEQVKEKSDDLKTRVKDLENEVGDFSEVYVKDDDDYKKLEEKVSNSLTLKGFATVTSIVVGILAIIGTMIGYAIKK